MRRLIFYAVGLLLIGMVFNVAVGWACVLLVPLPGHILSIARSEPTQAEIDRLPREWRHPYQRVDRVSYERRSVSAPGKSVRAIFVRYRTGISHTLGRNHGLVTYTCGWPARSLTGDAMLDDVYYLTAETIEGKSKWSGAVRVPGQHERRGMDPLGLGPAAVALPYRPVWPGFAINTLLYALLLLAGITVVSRSRAAVRLRAGLCPACKYPIGASPICTECGRAVPPRRHTA
ncbi:MAG: hypothetical protein IT436_17960 [Phycisphaerales bacterium]|nr:hypothetical protein [Phycisphaerales bacterium]